MNKRTIENEVATLLLEKRQSIELIQKIQTEHKQLRRHELQLKTVGQHEFDKQRNEFIASIKEKTDTINNLR